MNPFAVIFAICCLASARARPTYSHGGGGGGGGNIKLEGVPNESHYGKLTYPKYDILELGSAIKDSLPPAVITINKKVLISQPKPYPVKIPVPVPHPVEVAKPYPVVETKIIKVPHPVPVEVVKKVPVPFEVPKPYPVPTDEFKAPHFQAPVASYGGSFSGHGQIGLQHAANEVQENQDEGGYGGGGYDGGFGGGFEGSEHAGGYAEADQSGSYGAQVQAEPAGWVPVEAQQVDHQQ